MSAIFFWLSDEAWAVIEPHLPRGKPGKPRVDDRTVISGILHVLKTGCRWCDVPAAYGPPTTIYNRWSQRRVWQRPFEQGVASGPVPRECQSIAATSKHIVRHQAQKGGVRRSSRTFARRPDVQNPLPGRRLRPSGRHHSDARPC